MDAKTLHPTWRIKIREAYKWGLDGWEAYSSIPPEYCPGILGVVQCIVSPV
jgi:hypothetical protein